MPNQIGDTGICHSWTPAGEIWLEVEITALDGDPIDPQPSSFKFLRIAYVLNDGWEFDNAKLGKLAAENASPDRDNLVWNNVPVPLQEPSDGHSFVWRKAVT